MIRPMCGEYPREITDQERELGFEHIQVPNPRKAFGGPKQCTAVARQVRPSEHIFKLVSELDGSIYYKHWRWGVFSDCTDQPADWIPCGSETYANPELAIHDALSDLTDDEGFTVTLRPFPPA